MSGWRNDGDAEVRLDVVGDFGRRRGGGGDRDRFDVLPNKRPGGGGETLARAALGGGDVRRFGGGGDRNRLTWLGEGDLTAPLRLMIEERLR